MKKQIQFTFLLTTLMLISCVKREIETNNRERVILEEDTEVLNERVTHTNEELDVTGRKEKSATAYFKSGGESPGCNDCDEIVSGNQNNLKIKNKKTYCVLSGTSLSGKVTMQGGTLYVCGSIDLNNINGSKGDIVINEGATATLNNSFNANVINYSTLSFSSLNVNGSGSLENYGEVTVSGNTVFNGDLLNHSEFTVSGNLTMNGGSKNVNTCKIVASGNLQLNGDIDLSGYLEIGGVTQMNGSSDINMTENSYFTTALLTLNGDIHGPESPLARVDIASTFIINGSGDITGYVDLNTAAGQGVDAGEVGPNVTQNQDALIPENECNPGAGEPIPTTFTLVAEVASPAVNGNKLSATDVKFNDGRAYVSYHLNGPAYSGAFEIYNVQTPNLPTITQLVDFDDSGFNGFIINGESTYLVGQRSTDKSKYVQNETRGAILEHIPLVNGLMDAPETFEETPLPSFTGNSIIPFSSSQLSITTGAQNGGIFILDNQSYVIQEDNPIDFVKYQATDPNYITTLIAESDHTQLLVEDINGGLIHDVTINKVIQPRDGKNVVHIDDAKAYITLGNKGMAVVDLSSGQVVGEYDPNLEGLTNGLDIDENYIYLANGEDGLLILDKITLQLKGQLNFSGSSNLVKVDGSVIFVANGTGGLKIILKS